MQSTPSGIGFFTFERTRPPDLFLRFRTLPIMAGIRHERPLELSGGFRGQKTKDETISVLRRVQTEHDVRSRFPDMGSGKYL